jgi:uncharacterized protein YndB with AHSA1/START domain
MNHDFDSKTSIVIHAPAAAVWDALVNPAIIKRYLFGTNTASEWKRGSRISFTGEWEGKPYEEGGFITEIEPERILQYTHYSSMSGLPDLPENYHLVTFELAAEGNAIRLSLSQDNNPTVEARDQAVKNWAMILEGMKKLIEEERIAK